MSFPDTDDSDWIIWKVASLKAMFPVQNDTGFVYLFLDGKYEKTDEVHGLHMDVYVDIASSFFLDESGLYKNDNDAHTLNARRKLAFLLFPGGKVCVDLWKGIALSKALSFLVTRLSVHEWRKSKMCQESLYSLSSSIVSGDSFVPGEGGEQRVPPLLLICLSTLQEQTMLPLSPLRRINGSLEKTPYQMSNIQAAKSVLSLCGLPYDTVLVHCAGDVSIEHVSEFPGSGIRCKHSVILVSPMFRSDWKSILIIPSGPLDRPSAVSAISCMVTDEKLSVDTLRVLPFKEDGSLVFDKRSPRIISLCPDERRNFHLYSVNVENEMSGYKIVLKPTGISSSLRKPVYFFSETNSCITPRSEATYRFLTSGKRIRDGNVLTVSEAKYSLFESLKSRRAEGVPPLDSFQLVDLRVSNSPLSSLGTCILACVYFGGLNILLSSDGGAVLCTDSLQQFSLDVPSLLGPATITDIPQITQVKDIIQYLCNDERNNNQKWMMARVSKIDEKLGTMVVHSIKAGAPSFSISMHKSEVRAIHAQADARIMYKKMLEK